MSKELKNDIEILEGQVIFKLRVKPVKILFSSITQELLGLSSFDNLLKDAYIIFQKGVDNFEIEYNEMPINALC